MILGHSTENTSSFLVHVKAIFRKFPPSTSRTLQCFLGETKSMRFLADDPRNVNKVVGRWFSHHSEISYSEK